MCNAHLSNGPLVCTETHEDDATGTHVYVSSHVPDRKENADGDD